MTKPKSPSTPYNGILTHDSVIDGYIAFPTRTDAMVASLALSLRIDSAAMDVVFAILRDSTFNLAEMRLRRTEDIYLHVAEQRRRDAEPRIISSIPSERIIADLEVAQSRTTIPPIVLEEVIALMDEMIDHNIPDNETDWQLVQSLRNLALVQRRYTLPARRVLGRFCQHSTSPTRDQLLRELIRDPCLGPWTHNFYLLMTSKKVDRVNVGEVTQYMTTLHAFFTERITGLRALTLAFEKVMFRTDHFEGIFSSLRELRELKLVPHYCKRSDPLLSASQCRTILSLPKLKHLTIYSWRPLVISACALPSNFASFTPSPSLQAFLIEEYQLYHRVGDQLVESEVVISPVWTRTDQEGEYALSTMVVDFPPYTHPSPDKCSRLSPLLHQLEHLYVSSLPDGGQDILLWMFAKCTQLRTLYFATHGFPSDEILHHIPSSVEKLALQFSDKDYGHDVDERSALYWDTVDSQMQQALMSRAWPNLRVLHVFFKRRSFREVILPFSMRKVKALCEEVHPAIDFDFQVLEWLSRRHANIRKVLSDVDILHRFRYECL